MDPERDDDTDPTAYNAYDFAADLEDILYDANVSLADDRAAVDFRSFAADGIRYNAGFTVRLSDGIEFQVTIVRSN